ncbi:MAG: uracil phosphoribosyltransferase [Spirochaetales bacterium]|jgi:uracil phosphoribosyltransferase|nr:uracil phosphoribosyltransferase [Spirochaetales bacterium]
MNGIILKATDLDGYLSIEDKSRLEEMNGYYDRALSLFSRLENANDSIESDRRKESLIELYAEMGDLMRKFTEDEESIHVYSFETPRSTHGEASRLIAKLRDPLTTHQEFVYYIQRAYELLFNLSVTSPPPHKQNYIIARTPVSKPVQNYSVHKIPDVDEDFQDSVMCVMLRGALLPSMIMSKEIQEYTSNGYVTPFALFRIKRDDSKQEHNMEYILNLEKSFFDIKSLDGKDLIFADPMNATGGSLVTIVTYLRSQGIKPRSIRFFNAISALKGSLRIVRALEDVTVYTLWMDPVLNDAAYIMPGLGDAGDRINGPDHDDYPRNIIQLIADYGLNITELYRSQVRKIEETVLG